MHWTTHIGYNFAKTPTLRSTHLNNIAINAESLYASYEKWAITDPQNNRVLELVFFPFIETAEIVDLKNNTIALVTAACPQQAVQKYFYQMNKTAEQADTKIESRLQHLAR